MLIVLELFKGAIYRIMKSKQLILAMVLVLSVVAPALASSSSTNYSIEESTIGPGGFVDSSSASYSARATLGDIGIGNAMGTLYQIYAGYTTASEEFLELEVTGATIDFDVLSSGSTATGTGVFRVRTYIAQSYVVASSGGPPTNGSGDVIDAMSSQAGPLTGQEQFGFNLVANTDPAAFGANPSQVPDSNFSFGYAGGQYDDADLYKYVEGETIAASDSSSGVTEYTIAYIMNIDELTPAGVYNMAHSIIATPTY